MSCKSHLQQLRRDRLLLGGFSQDLWVVRIDPIYKQFRYAIWKGNNPILRGRKLTMVINHLQVLG